MNSIYDLAICCRACLRVESSLSSINALDNDNVKFSDKLIACISDIVIKYMYPFIKIIIV